MKKTLIVALGLSLIGIRLGAEAQEYIVTVTPIQNVAHYNTYRDTAPQQVQDTVGGYLYYYRVGDSVTVYGKIDVQATAANTLTTLRLSLPYNPHFTNYYQAAGSGVNPGSKPPMSVWACVPATSPLDNTVNCPNSDEVVLNFVPNSTDIRAYLLHFTYTTESE